jgi:hypothetical protein
MKRQLLLIAVLLLQAAWVAGCRQDIGPDPSAVEDPLTMQCISRCGSLFLGGGRRALPDLPYGNLAECRRGCLEKLKTPTCRALYERVDKCTESVALKALGDPARMVDESIAKCGLPIHEYLACRPAPVTVPNDRAIRQSDAKPQQADFVPAPAGPVAPPPPRPPGAGVAN